MKATEIARLSKRTIALFCYQRVSPPTTVLPCQFERNVASWETNLHCVLQFCSKSRNSTSGAACHAMAVTLGLGADTLTSNMLMSLYSRCGLIGHARRLFEGMHERSLVSWNTMIAAHIRHEEGDMAVMLFLELLYLGYSFSEYTLSTVLCTAVGNGNAILSRQIHALAVKAAMDNNCYVGTALLDAYARNGHVSDAWSIFEGMEHKTGVTWSTLIAGFVQNEHFEQALALFASGRALGLDFLEFSLSSAVCACSGMAGLIEGKQIHSVVFSSGFGSNVFIAASLIDMYSRCGSIKEAYIIFSEGEKMNLVLWNVMISGLAKHSHTLEAMVLFEKMQQTGLYPDEVTYVSVLSACSHKGLVHMARIYFDSMESEHNVSRSVLHYSCMVDVLGRSGLTTEAFELMKEMPFDVTAPMWGSLLASCRTYGALELAQIAARKLIELEPDNAGNYILLCHMFAANKQWDDAAKTWKFLQEHDVKKETGESWIELKGRIHCFSVGERRHSRITEVLSELNNLQEEMRKIRDIAHCGQTLYYLE